MLDINLSDLIQQIDDNLNRIIFSILKPVERVNTSHNNWVNRLKSNDYTETYCCPPGKCEQCKNKKTCKHKSGTYLTLKYTNSKELEHPLAIPLDNKISDNWSGTILSGYKAIQDIKNKLASLSITDKPQAKEIIKRYLDSERLSLLQNLSFAVWHSILYIPDKENLAQMVDKLITEIKRQEEKMEISDLLRKAVQYELITDYPVFGSKNYQFQVTCIEEIYSLGFTKWLRQTKGLPWGDGEKYTGMQTWENFLDYLKDEKAEQAKNRARFEAEKEQIQQYVNPQQKEPEQAKPQLHFTRQFTEQEQQELYNGLINEAFLSKGTDYSHFCYAFGSTAISDNKRPFKPLVWYKTIGLLAYMIDTLFADTNSTNLWEITTQCFVSKGKAPNKDSLKNAVSKYKQETRNRPKGYERLDTILSL
jgi:hypothetical protein